MIRLKIMTVILTELGCYMNVRIRVVTLNAPMNWLGKKSPVYQCAFLVYLPTN